MTINVHERSADEYFNDRRYVLVGRWDYEATDTRPAFARLEFEDTELYCLRQMRGWSMNGATDDGTSYHHKQFGYCLLSKDHRGKCSTVVFACDVCGQTYRGNPTYSDDEVMVCFLCSIRARNEAIGLIP